MERTKKTPSVLVSALSFVAVLGIIIFCVKMKINTQMSIFAGACVAIVIAMLLGNSFEKDIFPKVCENVTKCVPAIFILYMVGTIVAIWMMGGTLPSMIYYGLKVIKPSALLPLTFILCALASVFTGTSLGSIATMGVVMVGIGGNMGIPLGIVAGAVISGSFFGDKMSPMSDSTNVASAMAGTGLYDHIYSMLYSTIPASIITLILYAVIGMRYTTESVDYSSIQLMMDTLVQNYHISFVTVIPIFLLLLFSAMQIPAVLAMGCVAIVSAIFAIVTQGANLSGIMGAACSGYVSQTGIGLVDTILSRGGISSMTSAVVIIFFSCAMGGALQVSKVLDVLMSKLLDNFVTSPLRLVLSTMIYAYAVLITSGSQYLGCILPAKTFADYYDKFDIDRKVLSRTCGDTGTLFWPLIPWSNGAVYTCSVLGVGLEYVPWSFLCFIVPVFTLICAATGFGMWNSKGEKLWKR